MDYPLPSNDPLGTDVQIDQNGDLVTLTSGDVSLVQNADNVSQSVRINMTTIPSTYLWGDGVGSILSEYVDEPITDYDNNYIQSVITQMLNDDDRIIEVQNVDIDTRSIVDGLLITIQALVDSIGVVQIPVVLGGANG